MRGAIYVDISDLMGTITEMKSCLGGQKFQTMMNRTFRETGAKVKAIVRKEVPKQYEVTAAWAGGAVGSPQMQKMGVVIPIRGKRGSIGGTFHAMAWQRGRKVRGRVRAKIVKGNISVLPETMKHQGGQPPFMAGGVAFTRRFAKKAYPIVHVVGLGVPQMPVNRSRASVEGEIRETLEKRLNHNFTYLFSKK